MARPRSVTHALLDFDREYRTYSRPVPSPPFRQKPSAFGISANARRSQHRGVL